MIKNNLNVKTKLKSVNVKVEVMRIPCESRK